MAPVKARNKGMIKTTFSRVKNVMQKITRIMAPPMPLPMDFILAVVIVVSFFVFRSFFPFDPVYLALLLLFPYAVPFGKRPV